MNWERPAAPAAMMPSVASSHPLYLHFLDRELVEAAGAQLNPAVMESSLIALTLGTSVAMYCGISVIWEHTLLNDASRSVLAMLVDAGAIRPVSYSATVEEFFESRLELYHHDAARYPLYFEKGIDAVRSIVASDYKAERTTDHLMSALGAWSLSSPQAESEAARTARSTALQALAKRDKEAITFAYFAPFNRANGGRIATEYVLRRQISTLYADHYLRFSDGDIPTGVAGLGAFDPVLAKNFPAYDVPLIATALRALGFDEMLRTSMLHRRDDWQLLLGLRGFGVHARVAALIRLMIWMGQGSAEHGSGHELTARRYRIAYFLMKYLRSAGSRSLAAATVEARLESAEMLLEAAVSRLSRAPGLTPYVEVGRQLFLDYAADVLVVTATEVETRAVLEAFQADHGSVVRPHHVGDKTYFDLGRIGGAQIYLVQTEMGSGGPSGSILTISEAMSVLKPSSVLLVGIAFGAARPDQNIGEVLVSRQVLCYDLQRVGSHSRRRQVVLRGDRASASSRLLDRCRSAVLDWNECAVRFGLIISGDKVVDDMRYRDQLIRLAGGEVLGGEMEGAGVYASAQRRKVDWIIIKAICDWADGEKALMSRERQSLAAGNAARFVSHLLGKGGLA